MRHDTQRILLTAATLCAAGCAKSDLQFAREGRSHMRAVAQSARANAPEEKPPKILPETHFAAGLLFERQGQIDRAILQYRKAVALNHNFVAAFHRLGLLQSATGQHLEAAQTLQRAVVLRPDSAVLHNDLGFEWMRAQQWDAAERELRRAVELQPDLATAHINLALVLAKFERFVESLASFQTVLPDADAYYNLGLMYRGQQRYGEAVETFRRVLTINPEFSAAKIQLEQLAARIEVATPVEAVAEASSPTPQSAGGETGVETPLPETPTPKPYPIEPGLADVPCEEDTTMPSLVAPMDDDFTQAEKNDDEPAAQFIEETPVVVEVAETMGPPAPCDGEIEVSDTDNVIVTLPAVPATQPTSVVDSWAMLAELEAKIAMLRYEIQISRSATTSWIEPGLMNQTLAAPPTWIEQTALTLDDDPVATGVTDGKIGFLDAPFIENDEERIAKAWRAAGGTKSRLVESPRGGSESWFGDALKNGVTDFVEEPPAVAEVMGLAVPTAPCDPEFEDVDADDVIVAVFKAPLTQPACIGDSWTMLEELEAKVAMLRYMTRSTTAEESANGHTSLWTAQFGELTELLSIVRNESACWEEIDARTRELLASGGADWPWVEGIKQVVPKKSEVSSTAMQSDPVELLDRVEHERSAGRAGDRSGEVYATPPRGLKPLPD